jgi:hypothetical protein
MTTDAVLFARAVARVAYYFINMTKYATAACCSKRAPDADDLSSRVVYRHLAAPISGDSSQFGVLRLAILSFYKCQQVATGGNRWHPRGIHVATGGNRWLLVAVRTAFGMRLGHNQSRQSLYLTSIEESVFCDLPVKLLVKHYRLSIFTPVILWLCAIVLCTYKASCEQYMCVRFYYSKARACRRVVYCMHWMQQQ